MISREVQNLERENAKLKNMIRNLTLEMQKSGDKPMACEYCKYFIQYYIKANNNINFTKTFAGHCTHGRMKRRKPDDSCQYFELGKFEY